MQMYLETGIFILNEREFAASELADANDLRNNLRMLSRYVNNFTSALSLFRFCETKLFDKLQSLDHSDQQMLVNWQRIAARDGAMSIYHFFETMGAAKTCLNKCKIAAVKTNKERFKEARMIFKKAFPISQYLRNSVAHPHEFSFSQDNLRKHGFTGTQKKGSFAIEESTNCVIGDALDGCRYVTTHNNKIIDYNLDVNSYNALRHTEIVFMSAFPPLIQC